MAKKTTIAFNLPTTAALAHKDVKSPSIGCSSCSVRGVISLNFIRTNSEMNPKKDVFQRNSRDTDVRFLPQCATLLHAEGFNYK